MQILKEVLCMIDFSITILTRILIDIANVKKIGLKTVDFFFLLFTNNYGLFFIASNRSTGIDCMLNEPRIYMHISGAGTHAIYKWTHILNLILRQFMTI